MTAPTPLEEATPSRARTVIAGARHALLTLPYERLCGRVGLLDDGGEPILLVTAGSPPAHAAGSSPTARVDIHGPQGERLVLSGSLRVVPGPATDVIARLAGPGCPTPRPPLGSCGHDHDLVAIAMIVAEVALYLLTPTDPGGAAAQPSSDHDKIDHDKIDHSGTDRGGTGSADLPRPRPTAPEKATTGSSRRAPRAAGERDRGRARAAGGCGTRIDLIAYALAEPDLIAAYAPDLVAHLNTVHAEQIRRLAEHTVAVDTDQGRGARQPAGPRLVRIVRSGHARELAGAQITRLDHQGLDMWRMGPSGAEEIHLPFRAPLREPRELGREIRWLLGLV
ncbi:MULTISPECIES: DUF2470 domain-containing protein [Protofrankia]|uniref:DUF2470 domain-containing protein n=1 Tax=Candidatus Protofrankia datiscae TaxID=2716812 RepID=F8B014_9ACTN|nr:MULTISPECIES: DUF2470 domain-containing protein [Protofrankia]AEH11711.1 hypothetical protein FsymDg_4462 [Candidatus Protofrankia datiscae]